MCSWSMPIQYQLPDDVRQSLGCSVHQLECSVGFHPFIASPIVLQSPAKTQPQPYVTGERHLVIHCR
jgi:hypothetical protein